MSAPQSHIAVYARWRPLTQQEAVGTQILTKTTSSEAPIAMLPKTQNGEQHLRSITIARSNTKNDTLPPDSWKSPPAFTTIFDARNDNKTIHDTVVAPAIPKLLTGQNFSVFAYGHSGSGKTHTIIGPNKDDNQVDAEAGLCIAAARQLFRELDSGNTEHNTASSKHLSGIGLSVFELRKSSAFDLLSSDRKECFIRQGPDGKTHIRGSTETLEGGKVRVRPLTQVACFDILTLEAKLNGALKRRKVGSSTIHDASSRTHCVIELEIVSQELVSAREELWDRQSELVPVGKWATDVMIEEQIKGLVQDQDGKWVANPEYAIDQARIDLAEKEKEKFEAIVRDAEKKVEDILGDGGVTRSNSGLGAKLVFVDLAGAEYHTEKGVKASEGMTSKIQTAQEKQEGRQINTDLLALKEVIRAWSSGQSRIPFRSSPLTMVLREHFLSGGNSSSAMIVTASPASNQHAATMNSLKYGALVGATASRS